MSGFFVVIWVVFLFLRFGLRIEVLKITQKMLFNTEIDKSPLKQNIDHIRIDLYYFGSSRLEECEKLKIFI